MQNLPHRNFQTAHIHPHYELQELVKDGYGFAPVCEGAVQDAELTTRPIAGMDWALGTTFVYNRQRHPKTIPILPRRLKKQIASMTARVPSPSAQNAFPSKSTPMKRPPKTVGHLPEQLSLLG